MTQRVFYVYNDITPVFKMGSSCRDRYSRIRNYPRLRPLAYS